MLCIKWKSLKCRQISGAIFSFSVVIGQPIIIFTFLASLYVICGTIAHFISKEESDRIDAPAKSVTEIEMEEEKKPLEVVLRSSG